MNLKVAPGHLLDLSVPVVNLCWRPGSPVGLLNILFAPHEEGDNHKQEGSESCSAFW